MKFILAMSQILSRVNRITTVGLSFFLLGQNTGATCLPKDYPASNWEHETGPFGGPRDLQSQILQHPFCSSGFRFDLVSQNRNPKVFKLNSRCCPSLCVI